MHEPIKAGDLAIIVRAKRCGCAESVGWIVLVEGIQSHLAGRCYECGQITYTVSTPAAIVLDSKGRATIELSRLKRIPPLSELEGEKNDSKLTEPA